MPNSDNEPVDNFPFDRPHWTISVSFPVRLLPSKDRIFSAVEDYAQMRGGASAGRCWPTPAFCGRPGYETFGVAIAFEAGDANGKDFAWSVRKRMAENCPSDGLNADDVLVSFDPEDVTYPAPEDSYSNRRQR
jgi:hypothetical protein